MNNIQSPDNTDRGIESEIQARGLTAPRVTPQDIADNIAAEYWFTAASALKDCPSHPSLELLTFCVLVLRNGFTVTGESACASPENFDAEIGRRIARENAVQKIWPLMGYQLKEVLYERRGPYASSASELQEKFADDSAAWTVLGNNFTCKAGMLRPVPGYEPTHSDYEAVDYLILEWDYGYEGRASEKSV